MRSWILATIVIASLAVVLAMREISHFNEIKSLRDAKEDLAIQQQDLVDRIKRAEEKLDQQPEQISYDAGAASQFTAVDISRILQRVTMLENQLRARQAGNVPEYDPTIPTPQPEAVTNTPPKRNWGPEQTLGAPDTERNADAVTAWAPLKQNSGPEWLAVGFDHAVEVAQIRIRESYNPGAITKVTTFANSAEIVLWEGTSAGGKAPRDFVVSITPGIRANSIIVYLDTARVSGWNEIDAVELVGRDASRQWATSADASSTYADR